MRHAQRPACGGGTRVGKGGDMQRERVCARHIGVTHGVPLEHRVSAALFSQAIDRREMLGAQSRRVGGGFVLESN